MYSTPSPNLSPYIFLGLDPSPPPLMRAHANDAKRCNTLQHTATHCNSLHLTVAHCNTLEQQELYRYWLRISWMSSRQCCKTVQTLQHTANTATPCNALQHTATHCNSRQLTATHCNTLQQRRLYPMPISWTSSREFSVPKELDLGESVLQCVAVCCSVLQCVAACCSMLQCVAVCCTVLQLQFVLQCFVPKELDPGASMLQCVAVCCSVLC